MTSPASDAYLTAPLGAVYLRTAPPIILVMSVNGLLSLADALFLGWYVGADALAAVTLMFPVAMLITALSTWIAGGMSSLLARRIGAGDWAQARAVFAGAHGLALLCGAGLIALFLLGGRQAVLLAAGGSDRLAELGYVYLRITVFAAPLMFVLSVNSDALRNEGRVGFMAAASLLVSLANIGFNYVLIAIFQMGVAGSAYGAVLAQAAAFAIILGFRSLGRTELRLSALGRNLAAQWRGILALGAPQSLNFVGLALSSAAIIAALQWVRTPDYDAVAAAYGVTTRLMTFVYLPFLGLSHAMQTVTGVNFGAGQMRRVQASLTGAALAAFVYCGAAQLAFAGFAPRIGALFVDDPAVIAALARILPVMTALLCLTGPLLIVAMHFQAIGEAGRAALLALAKPYLFAIPLTFALAAAFGERGVWAAAPTAEALLLMLTLLALARGARSRKWGLIPTPVDRHPPRLPAQPPTSSGQSVIGRGGGVGGVRHAQRTLV